MEKIKIFIEEGSENMDKRFANLLLEFIPFVCDFIELKKPFTLYLVHSKVPQLRTTGVYINTNSEIWIRTKGRNLIADVFRSISHEMVHHKQNEMGILNDKSGEDESMEEGMANRIAGIVIRKFGKKYPEIYE